LIRESDNSAVSLGEELGRGGEGAVYLVDVPGCVAKIYRRQPSASKVEKLRSMARHVSPELLRVAAWPTDLLKDEDGQVRGFLMPKVSARFDLHELYSPKGRRRKFPTVDFRFVVRVATNLARAFAQVHADGHVIGDVNHGNALVGTDGTVMLIDCDSFQVRHLEITFDCEVGTPLFTPPELQGQSFRGLRRTAEHDAFGLALLAFHLLYLGRHPFAGRYVEGEMPIERAIAEARFAYGAGSEALGMSPPPGTLPLTTFGTDIAALFEAAFAAPAAPRPVATQWVDALYALESQLSPCADSSAHFHPRAQPCCWCEVEETTGVRVYGTESNDTIAAVIAELWEAILAAPRPEPAPRPPTLAAFDGPDEIDVKVGATQLKLMLAALAATAGIGVWVPGLIEFAGGALVLGGGLFAVHYAERRKVVQQAARELQKVLDAWDSDCAAASYEEAMASLEDSKTTLLKIVRRREQRLAQLPDLEAQRLRADHLDSYALWRANLRGMRDGMLATLQSYGIETADDVLRMPETIAKIVDEEWAATLRGWATAIDSRYQVDPEALRKAIVSNEEDARLQKEQAFLLRKLRLGTQLLNDARAGITRRRNVAEQRFIEARRALMLARSGTAP